MTWANNIGKCKTSSLRTLALCLMMILTACGHLQQEIPGPDLQISEECDKLPGKVGFPKQNRKGKIVLSEAMDGMKKMRDRIDAKDECYRSQRAQLAGKS